MENSNVENKVEINAAEGMIKGMEAPNVRDLIKPIMTVKINVNRGPVDMDRFCDLTRKKYNDQVEVMVMPVENDADAGVTWSYLGDGNDDYVTLIKKDSEDVVTPFYAHEGDLGMDITATGVEYDEEHDYYIYHTGIHLETPTDVGVFIFPRSSNRKTEAFLCNSVGLGDACYRGEYLLCFRNRTSYEVRCMLEEWKFMKGVTDGIEFNKEKNVGEAIDEIKVNATEPFKMSDPMDFAPYKVGDKIGQFVFYKKLKMTLKDAEELGDTERGDGGFGSTGN